VLSPGKQRSTPTPGLTAPVQPPFIATGRKAGHMMSF
jgi:hypothetical protein